MATAEGDDPFLGKEIARNFKIEKLLGVGGMGKVYKARQLSLDKDVVIKVLHDHFRDDPQLVQRFQREARAASRLNHPNSIQVIDFGQDDSGVLFMAIEFLNGTDLFTVLQKEGPLPAERIARIMIQVCSALGEAHEMNVIHRDLKPENIMVEDRRGRKDVVKVLDFGIAKIQDPDDKGGQALTQAGMVCGTPEYMSPEQARGQSLDARSDLYSLGVLVYQLATGDLPFMADSPIGIVTKHILEKPEPPRQKYPHLNVPEKLEAIILRSMAKDAGERYQTAGQMQLAFEDYLRTASGAVPGFEEPSQMAILTGGSHAAPPTSHMGSGPAAPTEAEQPAHGGGPAATPAPSGAPTGAGTQVQMSATGSGMAAQAGPSQPQVLAADSPRLTSPTPTGLSPATFDDELAGHGGGGAKKAAILAVVVLLVAAGAAFALKDTLFGEGGDKVVDNGDDPGAKQPDGTDPTGKQPDGTDPSGTGTDGQQAATTQKTDPGDKPSGTGGKDATATAAKKDDPPKRGRRGRKRDVTKVDDKTDEAADDKDDKDDKDGRRVVSRRGSSKRDADKKPDDKDDGQKVAKADDGPKVRGGDRAKAKSLVKQANEALFAGNMDKAYKLAKEAITADPSYADSRKVIAGYHRVKGNKDMACAAAKDYVTLSKRSSSNATAYIARHCN